MSGNWIDRTHGSTGCPKIVGGLNCRPCGKKQSAWWHGLFINVSALFLHTRLHALRHATDQVIQRLARDLPPGELEAVYQAVPGGRSWYLVHLVLDDGPEHINPRPDGPLDFPPPDGGLLRAPPLSRLLGHVATRGKRHSKERQKSLRNHFGHF